MQSESPQCLQDGLKISREDSVAHSLLAVLYRGDLRYSDSITESKKAIAISPLNPAFHLVLAVTFEENQRYEEAIAESREAIRLRHNYATAYYHLAMSQERVGETQDAEQSWRAFLQIASSKSSSSEEVRIAREHLASISGQR
jgi:tetratricopeptide (TPR) repeat protein